MPFDMILQASGNQPAVKNILDLEPKLKLAVITEAVKLVGFATISETCKEFRDLWASTLQ